MILITGTNLTVDMLPLSDLMDYQIEDLNMSIKLKTVAKKPSCFKIFIAENLRSEYTITDAIAEKVVYFVDDADLIRQLEGSTAEEETDIFAEPPAPVVEQKAKPVPKVEDKPVVESISEAAPEPEPEPEPVPVSQIEFVQEQKELPVVCLVKKDSVEDKQPIANTGTNPYLPVVDLELDSVRQPDILTKPSAEQPEVDIEEADTALPDAFLIIPNIGDDTDSLRVALDNKDKIIAQKDSIIKELRSQAETSYDLQEKQIAEIKTLYQQNIDTANTTISILESKLSSGTYDSDSVDFLRFLTYARSAKAMVKEGFSDYEQQIIGTTNSKFTVLAAGAGDSMYHMLKHIKGFVDGNNKGLIVDFTGDNFLNGQYKLDPKDNTTLLFQENISPLSIMRPLGNAHIISTTVYNDIALLAANWANIISKLDEIAGGRNVLLLFGSISSFNVRYAVSKIASMFPCYVFAKCSPIILSTLFMDLKFVPAQRVNLVAMEYIDMVKPILAEIGKSFKTLAFATEIEWQKLSLK